MEKNFYPENFENFLRGHANQFKMSPSKKVWRGIYNDIHPGQRWPSIAMSIVFIFVLVTIGHLNTNNGHNKPLHDVTSINKKQSNSALSLTSNQPQRLAAENSVAENNTNMVSPPSSGITIKEISSNKTPELLQENKYVSPLLNDKAEFLISEKIENNLTSPGGEPLTASQDVTNNNSVSPVSTQINDDEKQPAIPAEINEVSNKLKKINNVTWQYYISPSVSYRNLSNNNVNNAVNHKPIIGYEAGTEMNFKIDKNLKFTTGIQLNYSGYNINANNTHPTMATLMLNTDIPGQSVAYSTISRYGNSSGTELSRLKNYSVQASIPIGLQYMLAENDNIKFGAAAAFQPSLIIAGNGYLLSTDKRNYMTEPDLFRRWNMNTNLTTFVSFESNSLNWQIGPQVRYQLLSTYSKRYPVKEHLVNYGIRIGISKTPK